MQINLIVGIDFTSSNKEINNPASLHFMSSNSNNHYEKAILSCGNIIAFYDYDQKFPVYGYGALLRNESNANHCFPVNFSEDPNVNSIENILPAYRNCLLNVKLYGPTNFAPLIRKTINIAQHSQKNRDIYYVLMILTDGQITDMDDTIDALVEASSLPISIIIIGIGTGDFGNMERLDADVSPLVSTQGVKSKRDLVQFVEFNKFQNDGILLASEVLEEIPLQIEQFYSMINQPPGDPIIQEI